jgi:dipeptidyl aminopeptidase/acylaminoacyl peptidase
MTFQDIIALRSVSDAQISPDGNRVAYTVGHADTLQNATVTHIYMVPSDGGTPVQFTNGDKSDSRPRWSPDGKWIAFVSARGEHPELYLISATGGEARQLTDTKTGVSAFAWSPDGMRVAYAAESPLTAEQEHKRKVKDDAVVIDHDFRFSHIYTIDVATKQVTPVFTGDEQASDPEWSPDGSSLAYVVTPTPKADDGRLTDIYVVPSAGGTPRLLVQNDGPDNAPRWSPDGNSIAYLTRIGKRDVVGQEQLAVIPAGGGTPRVITAGFLYQPEAATWSPDGRTLYFTANVRTTSQLFRVAAAGGAPEALTDIAGVMSAASFSRDGMAIAYTQTDMEHPSDVYVARVAAHVAGTRRTDQNPQVRDFALAKSEVIRWKAADGTDVEGILYYPLGYEPGKHYPMVAEIHGGPAGAWNQSFPGSWGNSADVWAARGWAVFFPNPRGSTNYGEKFLRANIKDWGGGDYHDIQAGIDHLVALGVADSSRLAQSGWSYGGYMTAWTLTQTNRFKAVMVGAGLTDMPSMYGTNDIPSTILEYFLGEPWDDPAQYAARSAMTFIKQARTPTLIQQGQADPRVPIGQSEELYLGLKHNNVPVQLVFFPREPHGLREPRHQLTKMENEYAWFAKWVLGENARGPAAVIP